MCVVEKRYKETIEYYKVYSALIYAAKDQKKLNYADVAKIMGIPENGNFLLLPEWKPGQPKPANWPPHIHCPFH